MSELEQHLVTALGKDKVKEIGEQLAEVVRQHGLQTSPEVCEMIFTYMIEVLKGWKKGACLYD